VGASIIGNCVVESNLLPDDLNGSAYCVFLQEVLLVLLEDVSLVVQCDVVSTGWGAGAF
jgi:hypothetical protein